MLVITTDNEIKKSDRKKTCSNAKEVHLRCVNLGIVRISLNIREQRFMPSYTQWLNKEITLHQNNGIWNTETIFVQIFSLKMQLFKFWNISSF